MHNPIASGTTHTLRVVGVHIMARDKSEVEERRGGEEEIKKAYFVIYKYNTRTQICKPLRRWKLTNIKNLPTWHPEVSSLLQIIENTGV